MEETSRQPLARGNRTATVRLAADAAGVLCRRCAVADRPLARMRGLLGRRGLEPGEGLLLRPANAVHTWFMRFEIDVVFLDADDRVLRICDGLRPWRMAGARGARQVLELPSGAAGEAGLTPGSRLTVGPAEQSA